MGDLTKQCLPVAITDRRVTTKYLQVPGHHESNPSFANVTRPSQSFRRCQGVPKCIIPQVDCCAHVCYWSLRSSLSLLGLIWVGRFSVLSVRAVLTLASWQSIVLRHWSRSGGFSPHEASMAILDYRPESKSSLTDHAELSVLSHVLLLS